MLEDSTLTRRALIGAGAGGAAALATAGLPAWARPVRRRGHLRLPDSLPFPHLPAGTPTMPEIRHIVVLMMENHSFDNLLGMVPYEVPGRHRVDGLTLRHGRFLNVNSDAMGNKVFAEHAVSPCQLSGKPSQSWNASHESYDDGRNDGFVNASGPIAMRFWDRRDIPFTYSLVRHFPIGQRFFCSTLCQTYPNRRFFFAGTASGTISTTTAGLLTSGGQRNDLRPAGCPSDRLARLLPGDSQPADHAEFPQQSRPSSRATQQSPSSSLTRLQGSCPPSRSSIRTTQPPRRRTPRTSRWASSSSPRS